MRTFRIRAVFFQEAGWWCAQCLEYDIATQARSLDGVKAELERALSIHVELAVERGQEPFAVLPRAPERYFQMYKAFEQSNGSEESSVICPTRDDHSTVETCVLARFAYPELASSLN
jgi:predicted RNase H-like HicB family nuclease